MLTWCLVRYLDPADHHPARIRKSGNLFEDELGFQSIRIPVKIKDIHKFNSRILSTFIFK